MEDKIEDAVEALGVTSVGAKARKLEGKEEKRMNGAIEEVQRLHCLPVSRGEKLRHCRTFGVSKCTHGWMARRPPQLKMTKATTAICKYGGGTYWKEGRPRGM